MTLHAVTRFNSSKMQFLTLGSARDTTSSNYCSLTTKMQLIKKKRSHLGNSYLDNQVTASGNQCIHSTSMRIFLRELASLHPSEFGSIIINITDAKHQTDDLSCL